MRRQMGRADAEAIAIRALGFLVSEPERLGQFLSLTGLGPDTVRNAAQDPHFLESVLDHIAADESLLISLAEHLSMKPETIAQAHALMTAPPFEEP